MMKIFFKAYYRFNDPATIKQIIAEIGFDQLEIRDYVEYVYLSEFLFKLQRFLHKGTFLGNTALLKSHFSHCCEKVREPCEEDIRSPC